MNYISKQCNKGEHRPTETYPEGCEDEKCKCACHRYNKNVYVKGE